MSLARDHILAIEGILSIANSLLDTKKSFSKTVAIEVLKVLSGSISQDIDEIDANVKYPIGSYIYKLRSELVKQE